MGHRFNFVCEEDMDGRISEWATCVSFKNFRGGDWPKPTDCERHISSVWFSDMDLGCGKSSMSYTTVVENWRRNMRIVIRTLCSVYLFLMCPAFVLCQGQKPAPEFTLAIDVERPSVKAGQSIVINLYRKNKTEHTINDNRTTNPMEYLNFRITRDGAPVDETAMLRKIRGTDLRPDEEHTAVSSAYFGKLKPGESAHETITVSDYFDMSKPGIYSVSVSQETYPGIPERSVTVNSNTITITELPADNSPSTQQ